MREKLVLIALQRKKVCSMEPCFCPPRLWTHYNALMRCPEEAAGACKARLKQELTSCVIQADKRARPMRRPEEARRT